jgi:hypothetical protein
MVNRVLEDRVSTYLLKAGDLSVECLVMVLAGSAVVSALLRFMTLGVPDIAGL